MELSAKPTSATTPLLSLCYRNNLARSEGFEPPTPRFEVWFSRTQSDAAELLAFRKPYIYRAYASYQVRLGSAAVSHFASPVRPQLPSTTTPFFESKQPCAKF